MKKLFLCLVAGTLLLSCSNDDNNSGSNLSDTPTAKADYDDSSYGLYKGVFVGSTGYVSININNDGTLSAKIVVDGKTMNFTTSETVNLESGITGLTFTSGDSSFDFNVGLYGTDAQVTAINIIGHAGASIYVMKEQSDNLVRCYQGTAKKAGESGSAALNMIIYNGELHGLAAGGHISELEGTVESDEITGHVIDEDVVFSGTINGNNISGEWHDPYDPSDHGTWTGKRKL